ncbi:hypothetical protein [Bacillus sp. FJAT-27251]|uniref:hypothetical protein n=1 Tax=Bacillus sp. FJAT-27251 TaxID=1684142 RepID=UPI0006A7B3BA|nr:hypothetical protein [Bacillus sp. FJAT-27251]
MKSSLKEFLNELIDYAGLFPPTKLPLDKAVSNYAKYQGDSEAWMLGPFVISIPNLHELDHYTSLFSKDDPLRVSVTGNRYRSEEEVLKGLNSTLNEIEAFRKKHRELVKVEALEIPLPPFPFSQELLEEIAEKTSANNLQVFCEATQELENQAWEEILMNTLDAIKVHNAGSQNLLLFKLRTGGVAQEMIPSPKQVAIALAGCRDRVIPMKFTAGLHHPFRMYRTEVGARMHGFVNVFTAGMFANVHQLDVERITEILCDMEPGNFSFNETGITWKDLEIRKSDISKLRKNRFYSFGCCSFDVPRDDLRELGILGEKEVYQ